MHGRNRWLLRGAVILIGGMLLYLLSTRGGPPGLTIENRSGQPITAVSLTRGEQVRTFRDVAVGSSVTVPIDPENKAPAVLEGQLADGTRLRGQFGSTPPHVVVLPGGQITVPPKKAD